MALDALFSFSYVPLRAATYLGLSASAASFIIIADVLYAKLVAGTAILGWASPLVSTLFLGGVQLIILGIIGEYLGRIYDEVKRRPYYIVAEKIGF
jgi:dolichol-phosphate mannosyltransferase